MTLLVMLLLLGAPLPLLLLLLLLFAVVQLLQLLRQWQLWDHEHSSIYCKFDTCLTLWYYSLLLPCLLNVLRRRRRHYPSTAAGATSWTEMQMVDCC